jgi:hypothetical protein
MITDKAKVLAAIAIADKIDIFNRRKEECTVWHQAAEDAEDEESKKFWTDAIECIDENIQEYSAARIEMING